MVELGLFKTHVLTCGITLPFWTPISLSAKWGTPHTHTSFSIFLSSLKPSKLTPCCAASEGYTPRVCRPILGGCRKFLVTLFSVSRLLVLSDLQVRLATPLTTGHPHGTTNSSWFLYLVRNLICSSLLISTSSSPSPSGWILSFLVRPLRLVVCDGSCFDLVSHHHLQLTPQHGSCRGSPAYISLNAHPEGPFSFSYVICSRGSSWLPTLSPFQIPSPPMLPSSKILVSQPCTCSLSSFRPCPRVQLVAPIIKHSDRAHLWAPETIASIWQNKQVLKQEESSGKGCGLSCWKWEGLQQQRKYLLI